MEMKTITYKGKMLELPKNDFGIKVEDSKSAQTIRRILINYYPEIHRDLHFNSTDSKKCYYVAQQDNLVYCISFANYDNLNLYTIEEFFDLLQIDKI